MKKIMISIDEDLLLKIDSYAKNLSMSRSNFIRFLFIEYVSCQSDILKFWNDLE